MPKRSPSGPEFPRRSPAPDASSPPPQVAETPPAGKLAPAPDLRTIDLKPAPAETAAAEARDALLRNSDPAIAGPAARAAGRSAPGSDGSSGNAAPVSGVAPAASAAAAVPEISNRTESLRDAVDRADASTGASAAERAVPGAFQDIARPSFENLQAKTGEAAAGMPGTDERYGLPGAEPASFGNALRAPGLNLIGSALADLDAVVAEPGAGPGLPGGGSPGHGNEAYQGMVESAIAAMTGGAGSDPFAVTSGRGAMSGSGELGLMQGALDAFSSSPVGPNVENDGGGQGGIELLKRAIAEAEAESRAKASNTEGGASGQAPQPGQAGQATTPGNAGAGAAAGRGPSQATGGGEAAGEDGLLMKALDWMSYKLYNRPFFGSPGNLPTVFVGNVNEAEQLRQVDDNAGTVDSKQPLGKVTQEAGIPNLEAAVFKSLGTGSKKPGGEGEATSPDAKQPIDETPDNPALRAWIYGHHKDQIDAMRAGRHGWDVDPAEDASDAPPAGNLGLAETAALQRGMTNFLIGNPGDPAIRGGTGSGSLGFGVLPGDRGNIDYGPDAAGQWTGSARTEDPADALSGFGGSGLSIADAHGTADGTQSGSSSTSDDHSDDAG